MLMIGISKEETSSLKKYRQTQADRCVLVSQKSALSQQCAHFRKFPLKHQCDHSIGLGVVNSHTYTQKNLHRNGAC